MGNVLLAVILRDNAMDAMPETFARVRDGFVPVGKKLDGLTAYDTPGA